MKHMNARFLCCLSGVVALYAASYAVYRQFGPTQYYWPRDSRHPIVLCRTESRSEVLMCHFFSPCIATEDAFYKWKHRNVKFTLNEWNATANDE